MSRATAVEALPEIGRTNIKGSSSDGILRTLRIGDKIFWMSSRIPEFLRALIAKNKAINVGNILITVSIPSFAPY